MRENWEYESKRGGWRFYLTIPDRLEPWDVEYIQGVFDIALDDCRRRLLRVAKFDGFEVEERETTASLLRRLEQAKAKPEKSAAEILSITCALHMHCA